MTSIAIILGSTRPGRRGEGVARWAYEIARKRTDADFELIDLADHPLPHLDEPMPPAMGQYQNQHTKDWAATIAQFDGFIFVTPEYNHSTSARFEQRDRLSVRRMEQQGNGHRVLWCRRWSARSRAPSADCRRAINGRRADECGLI